MSYRLSTITAKPGERLKVRVFSMGKLPSTVTTDNFVLLNPGSDFLCTFAGHFAAGMAGTLVVK